MPGTGLALRGLHLYPIKSMKRLPSDEVVGQYLQLIALYFVRFIVRPVVATYAAGYVVGQFTRKHYARIPVYTRYLRKRFA